jgi:hypothetical protein
MWLITAQLGVIVRMVFSDNSTKEEIPAFLRLKGKTKGGSINFSFKDCMYLFLLLPLGA